MSKPRFLLDEQVWGGLVEIGQEIGGDVLLLQYQLSAGPEDELVLVFAAERLRVALKALPAGLPPNLELVTPLFFG